MGNNNGPQSMIAAKPGDRRPRDRLPVRRDLVGTSGPSVEDNTPVDFDTNHLWVPLLTDAVGSLLSDSAKAELEAEKPQFVEDALRVLFSCTNRYEIIHRTLEWIRANRIAGYHGTRLLECEVASIRSNGLRPLEARARRNRLVRALSFHPSWDVQALDSALQEYGEGNKAGVREGQASLTVSRSGLLHGFNHYLAYGSEFDQQVAQALLDDDGMELLRADGETRIIQFSVPGSDALNAANPYRSIDRCLRQGEPPNLLEDFLKAWSYTLAHPDFDCATLEVDCGMKFCDTVPSGWIVRIETLRV